jgi:WD40 repeat protein
MDPYRLIHSIFAHDGPVRSLTLGPTENEIVTGCQSDSPNVRRWRLSADLMSVEEIGSPIFHDHWVTALTALKPNSQLPSLLQDVRHTFQLFCFFNMTFPSVNCRVVSLQVVWTPKFVSTDSIITS